MCDLRKRQIFRPLIRQQAPHTTRRGWSALPAPCYTHASKAWTNNAVYDTSNMGWMSCRHLKYLRCRQLVHRVFPLRCGWPIWRASSKCYSRGRQGNWEVGRNERTGPEYFSDVRNEMPAQGACSSWQMAQEIHLLVKIDGKSKPLVTRIFSGAPVLSSRPCRFMQDGIMNWNQPCGYLKSSSLTPFHSNELFKTQSVKTSPLPDLALAVEGRDGILMSPYFRSGLFSRFFGTWFEGVAACSYLLLWNGVVAPCSGQRLRAVRSMQTTSAGEQQNPS